MNGPGPATVTWPQGTTTSDAAGVACVDLPVAAWHEGVRTARDGGYTFFDWLSAVDESDGAHGEPGLDLVLHLAGLGPLRRLLLRTRVPAGAAAASVTDLFPGAAWHERETWEMFGLGFDGFEDGTGQGLRPLLLPDGFEGTPLRKNFVLASRAVKPWPGAKDPGDSGEHGAAPSRRRVLPPAVPDADWGPRPVAATPAPADPEPEAGDA